MYKNKYKIIITLKICDQCKYIVTYWTDLVKNQLKDFCFNVKFFIYSDLRFMPCSMRFMCLLITKITKCRMRHNFKNDFFRGKSYEEQNSIEV